MVARSGLFVAPVPGTPPVGTQPMDARIALTGILGGSPQTISGGAITQSATLMQFTVADAVWQLPDQSNSRATFLSATDSIVLTGTPGPATGFRIDLIVAKQNDYQNADADSRVNLSIVTGTASGSPVAPPTPAGAWIVAQISVGTGATNAAACTVYVWAPTVVLPPVRSVATKALLDATHITAPILPGTCIRVYADAANFNGDYFYNGFVWQRNSVIGETVPACRVGLLAAQNCGTSFAGVGWDAETVDTHGFHDVVSQTSRFTIPTGLQGTYRISAQVKITLASGVAKIQIFKNGVAVADSLVDDKLGSASANPVCRIDYEIQLGNGEYIEVKVTNTVGTAALIVAQCWASLRYIGPY